MEHRLNRPWKCLQGPRGKHQAMVRQSYKFFPKADLFCANTNAINSSKAVHVDGFPLFLDVDLSSLRKFDSLFSDRIHQRTPLTFICPADMSGYFGRANGLARTAFGGKFKDRFSDDLILSHVISIRSLR